MAQNGTQQVDDLLADLRESLREELNLARVPDKIKYLRFSFPAASENAGKDFVRGDAKRAELTSG